MAVIHEPEIEHKPIRVVYDYFERALQDIGVGLWFSLLKPGNEEHFRNKIKLRVYTILSFHPWQQRIEEILSQPEKHLRWETRDDPDEEIWAHYRLQSAVVATVMGDLEQLRTLAAQLITEPMNRKLAISYFLGNLTDGKVGLTYKDLPTKTQILRWVHEIGQIQSRDWLREIASLKYE